MQNEPAVQTFEVISVQQTTCCIVGSGPAGAVLALLLARQGIPVILLEEHLDFDRDFRGDTIHPSVMQILDEIGLADRVLELRHSKVYGIPIKTAQESVTLADLRRLKTRFPYVLMIPQAHFLEFITDEAKRYPNFLLVMGARVEKLVEEDGEVRGVYYRGQNGWHEVRASLTVATDGRFSRVRRLAGLEPIKTAAPMDVLWFRLPRFPSDPEESDFRISGGHLLVILNRYDYWQVGYIIPKGGYQEIRSVGLDALRREIARIVPAWADRLETLREWKQIPVLSVESNRLPRWYRPGLLLIGDAAHVMSPVGGVGINYAIQDAVVAANVLSDKLKAGKVSMRDLAEVQRRREWPTRIVQGFQSLMQKQMLGRVLTSDKPFTIPLFLRVLLRLPGVRSLPARFIALGIWPVHVKNQ